MGGMMREKTRGGEEGAQTLERTTCRTTRSKERCRCMGEKLTVLPGTGETDPMGFEKVTSGATPATLVIIGSQLVVRRHGGGAAPSARARLRPRSNSHRHPQNWLDRPLDQNT